VRDSVSEADIARALEGELRRHAVRWYHTFDARRSVPGFPDYVIVVGSWLLLCELKKTGGSPTAEQVAWLRALVGPGRLVLLVGGLDGAEQLARLVARIKSGTVGARALGAAGAAVQVLGSVSVRGRAAVAASADALPAAAAVAAGATMPPTRHRRDSRRRPRGS